MSKVIKVILLMTSLTLLIQLGCNQRSTEPENRSSDFQFQFHYGHGIYESPASLLQNDESDDLLKSGFLQTIDEARVMVLDISEYSHGEEFESSPQFDRYRTDWDNFTGDKSSWDDWEQLLSRYFNIVSNVELTIDSSNARGKASGAIGLNRFIVALIENGIVRYHGVSDGTGVEGETPEVSVYVSEWYYSNVVSLKITPTNVALGSGQTQQFTCTATYLDSSKGNVTSQSTWSTSPGSAGSISSTGFFTADSVASGTETVTATYRGYQAQTTVTVSGGGGSGTVVGIDLTPGMVTLNNGETRQFTCTATYDDNSRANVTSLTSWSTSPGTAGSISISGLFTASTINTGTEVVTAGYQGFSEQAMVTVEGGSATKTLTGVDVTPDTTNLANDETQQFTCTALYDDNSTEDVTNSAVWSLSPGTTGSINTTGSFTAHSTNTGTETVTADYQGYSDQATVSVTAGGGAQFTVVKTIDLERAPKMPLITPDGSAVYVPCQFANKVYVISTSSNSVLTSVDVSGYSYHDMAITSNGASLYVPDNGSSQVNVIGTATNTVAGVVDVGQRPCSPAVTPDGNTVYVPNMSSNDVSIISTGTNSVISTIDVGEFPTFAVVRPDGDFIYIINENSDNISVIATANNTLEATIDVGTRPRYGLVSDDGLNLYVTNSGSGTVSVINTSTNSFLETINVGRGARRLTLSPDGNDVYVSNYDDGTVSVFQVAVHTVEATINVGGGPGKPIFTPDGRYVYIPNWLSNSVSVISTSTRNVVETIPVGDSPIGGVVTPDGKYVYIVNTNGWTVSVIDNGP